MKNLSNDSKIERITPKHFQFFFGYYDISPESPDGSKILVNRAPFIDHMPETTDLLEVGYIETVTGTYHQIGTTAAWTFQEGCRLQWLSNDRCIYNARNGDHFESVVYDVNAGSIVRTYEIPIYGIAYDKKNRGNAVLATSYSFTNNKYNYAHTEEELQADAYKDGVYLLDLESGRINKIVTNEILDELAGIKSSNGQVEYCVFNEKGTEFYIYYRWSEDNGEAYTMICVSDIEGNVRSLLKSNFISHAGWCGNDKITAWGRMPSKINAVQSSSFLKNSGLWKVGVSIFHKLVKTGQMRQKFTGDAYIMFEKNTGSMYKLENKDFTSDGHCTWSSDERWMLTDTYPDEEGYRHLMMYDASKDIVYELGKFYSYPKDMEKKNKAWNESPMRCDLHPKWGRNGYIYFDSVHEGVRGLYRIKISDYIEDWQDE